MKGKRGGEIFISSPIINADDISRLLPDVKCHRCRCLFLFSLLSSRKMISMLWFNIGNLAQGLISMFFIDMLLQHESDECLAFEEK